MFDRCRYLGGVGPFLAYQQQTVKVTQSSTQHLDRQLELEPEASVKVFI